MTAKTPEGKEVYHTERHYHPQATTCRDNKMVYGAQWKVQYVRNTSLQPYEEKAETFEIELPEGVRTVDVTVGLRYEISTPDYKVDIYDLKRRVSVDRP